MLFILVRLVGQNKNIINDIQHLEAISAQTYSRISAKPKIRVLNRFKAQDLKIGSFEK